MPDTNYPSINLKNINQLTHFVNGIYRVLILGNWNRIIFGLGCNITHLNSPQLRCLGKNQSFWFASKAGRDEMKTPGFSDQTSAWRSDGWWESARHGDLFSILTSELTTLKRSQPFLGFSQKIGPVLKRWCQLGTRGRARVSELGDPGSPGDWSVYNDHKREYPSLTPVSSQQNPGLRNHHLPISQNLNNCLNKMSLESKLSASCGSCG